MVLEDGTGVAGANSYVSVDDCVAYCDDRGLTFGPSPTVEGEEAIIRASAAIDARYAGAFPGYRASGRDQGLEWPRIGAYDTGGWLISDQTVPIEVVQATCEAAVRELASPGVLMPDLKRGGALQTVKAGSVEVTWAGNASNRTTFSILDGIMARVLSGGHGSGGGLFGVASRG